MLKYHFLVYHKDVEIFLDEIQELGVIQVIKKGEEGDHSIKELENIINKADPILKKLKNREITAENSEDIQSLTLDSLESIENTVNELEHVENVKALYEEERRLLEPWGTNFSWENIDRLKKAGISIQFFVCAENKFKQEWSENYFLNKINEIGNGIYFVILNDGEEIELPLVEAILPAKSSDELASAIKGCESKEAELNLQLDNFAKYYLEALEKEILQAKDILEFKEVQQNLENLSESQIVIMEGWCPKTKIALLEDYLDSKKILHQKSRAKIGDKVPVLLKNNRFSYLFEPIGKLFDLPAYSDLDLTVYFAPFFLLFFGFCLGDAGYGLVLLLLTTIFKLRADKKYKAYFSLAQLFGLSTTIMGFFSGTLFGLEMVSVPLFKSVKQVFLSQDQLFNTALILGFIQILFGLGIHAYKNMQFYGWKHGISKIGWIILLLSLVDITTSKLVPVVSNISVWVGVGMIVAFGKPDKGPLASFGYGLADLYNLTGIMGDFLSYIRLFALGVASAILGLVVNSIAQSALGIEYVGVIIFIIILVIGHTGNFLLSSLSAFVHPMRLTFVEFYKNAGFIGGGKPYQPFSKKAKQFKNPETNS